MFIIGEDPHVDYETAFMLFDPLGPSFSKYYMTDYNTYNLNGVSIDADFDPVNDAYLSTITDTYA